MENAMTAVTVSPKYQVVIPKDVREQLGIVAGPSPSRLETSTSCWFLALL
jgi:hypothetical protein